MFTTEIDLVGEKQWFLTSTPFLNKGEVKAKKQDAIRQKYCQKTSNIVFTEIQTFQKINLTLKTLLQYPLIVLV